MKRRSNPETGEWLPYESGLYEFLEDSYIVPYDSKGMTLDRMTDFLNAIWNK